VQVDGEKYLEPLLNAVNKESGRHQGYRTVGRKLTSEFVRAFVDCPARPFLARELLNIPRLPYSPKELSDVVRGSNNAEEKEKEFIGYLVEREGTFNEYKRRDSYIMLTMTINSGTGFSGRYDFLAAFLPGSWLEIVEGLYKGQRIRARGAIQDFLLGSVYLNYVDLELLA